MIRYKAVLIINFLKDNCCKEKMGQLLQGPNQLDFPLQFFEKLLILYIGPLTK